MAAALPPPGMVAPIASGYTGIGGFGSNRAASPGNGMQFYDVKGGLGNRAVVTSGTLQAQGMQVGGHRDSGSEEQM